MVQTGKSLGLDFALKTDRYPYTLRSHVLLDYAKDIDNGAKQNDIAEQLFKVLEKIPDF